MRHDFDKGGDIEDITGTHWLLGVAGKFNPEKDHDLIGSFYAEAAGEISTAPHFARGHGDSHYYGVGVIGRYQQNEGSMKGAYTQINARIGRASTDFNSNLYDANSNRGEYDKESTYYGAGIGAGYLWDITPAWQLDLSAQYSGCTLTDTVPTSPTPRTTSTISTVTGPGSARS